MAAIQTVKIKRRNNSDDNAPGSLEVGELAYNEYQQVGYIGKDNGGAGQHQVFGTGIHVTWPGTGIIVQTAARSGATPPQSAARTLTGGTGITVTNGTGVSGNPTFDMDIDGLTTDTIAAADTIPFNDDGDGPNKITFSNFEGTLNHDNLAGVVANEHVDHSTVSITAGDGLTGGGNITATRTLSVLSPANAQTTAYTAVAGDKGDIIRFTGAGGVNLNLTAAATLGDGWFCWLRNDSSGDITVDPNAAETINGSATLVVEAGQAVGIWCNGTLFYTVGEPAAGAGANNFGIITGDSGTATSDTSNDTLSMVSGTGNLDGLSVVASDGPETITIGLDISGMADLAAAPDTADIIPIYDSTGTTNTSITVANLFTSPALTGTPTAPTAVKATNTTQIATTAHVKLLDVNDLTAPITDFDMNNNKITNLTDPTNDQDAATKAYVDATASGLDVKDSVRCLSASTSTEGTGYSYNATGGTSGRGQITWTTGPTSIDGVTLANNDRILNSETGAAGGIYVRTAQNTWDRATDFDEDAEVTAGAFTFIEEGTNNADSGWVLTTNNPITIGGSSGTSLSWAQFSGAGQITAGAGLTKTGNTLDVGAGTGITVNADTIQISATYAGQGSIVTVGTITSGTWNGTAISETYGGTGITTYAQGDILYADAANSLAALAKGAAGNILAMNAGATVPEWTDTIDGGTF